MEQLYRDLLDRLDHGIQKFNNSQKRSIEIATKNIKACLKLNIELKRCYLKAFHEPPEQIIFFKTIKPRFLAELSFQRSALQYFQAKPSGPPKAVKAYIHDQMDMSNTSFKEYFEMYKYIQLKSDSMDELYFTPQTYDPIIHGHLEFSTDSDFSSPADTTLSKLLATEKFQDLLRQELLNLKTTKMVPRLDSIKPIEWEGTQSELVEVLYGLYSHRNTKGDLKTFAMWFELMFDIEFADIYRTYNDIKRKKDPTSFLDEMKEELIKKIRKENGKK